MSPSCRSRRSVGMVIRMLVGAPYVAPRRIVNPPGPMLVMGAFNRGRIALICFSFMAYSYCEEMVFVLSPLSTPQMGANRLQGALWPLALDHIFPVHPLLTAL